MRNNAARMQATAEAAGPCWGAKRLRGKVNHPQTGNDPNSRALTGGLTPTSLIAAGKAMNN